MVLCIVRYFSLLGYTTAYNPLATLSRVAMLGCDLGDGTHVPPGFRVAVDIRAIHFDPDVYEDPDRCDLFRFSKMRAKDGADSKYGFAMVDSNVRR